MDIITSKEAARLMGLSSGRAVVRLLTARAVRPAVTKGFRPGGVGRGGPGWHRADIERIAREVTETAAAAESKRNELRLLRADPPSHDYEPNEGFAPHAVLYGLLDASDVRELERRRAKL